MKKILLSALLFICAISVNAQNRVVNNPDNHAYFGVRASFNLSSPDGSTAEAFSDGAGASLGVIYNIPLVANLYLEPGAGLYYNTWSMNKSLLGALGDLPLDAKLDASFRNFGMRIPVMLGYHFDVSDNVKLAVFTGPELNIGFTNDLHVSASAAGQSGSDTESAYGEKGLYNRVDCAWKTGVSVSYSDYYLGVSGSIGMLNLLKDADDNVDMTMNTLAITLGYNF